jgi:hypothetical protein
MAYGQNDRHHRVAGIGEDLAKKAHHRRSIASHGSGVSST